MQAYTVVEKRTVVVHSQTTLVASATVMNSLHLDLIALHAVHEVIYPCLFVFSARSLGLAEMFIPVLVWDKVVIYPTLKVSANAELFASIKVVTATAIIVCFMILTSDFYI